MGHPLACVIVVGWNSEKDLDACMAALSKQDYPNYKIIYVDNFSKDRSVELIEQKHPQVVVLEQDENLYFTGGNHVGISYAIKDLKADFIGLINPDTTCTSNWLSAQIELLRQDKSVGIVTPKVVFADGFGTDRHKSRQGRYVINTVGIEAGGFLFPYDRGFGQEDRGQFEKMEVVYAASGVSLVFRSTDYLRVNGFDLRMKMYLEDVDLCLKIKKLGKKVIYSPEATVYHKHMQSTHQQASEFYIKNSRANYLLLVYKHYPFKKLLRAVYVNFKELSLSKFVYTIVLFLTNLTKSEKKLP